MNKKLKLIPLGFVSALCLGALPFIAQSVSADSDKYLVYFMDNYEREEFELSSGFGGKGNNLPYQIVEVQANSTVAKPSTDPSRKNYEFGGWYKEATCENEWSFAGDIVSKNTFIYAKWSRGEEEIIPEPEYVPPSTVLDESAPNPYEINSVMGFVPNGTILRVSNVAITRLIEHKDDIRPLLDYKAKVSASFSATYSEGSPNGSITIRADGASDLVITVINDTTNYPALSNDTYESKAKKFEGNYAKENENYHVMLAGSSSMEFWESYKEDLDPVIAYNHGIGGTKVSEWTNNLNKRLVYPYKPKMVVYYVGVNNVKEGEATNSIINDLQDLFNQTHAALPDARIQYVLINKVPLESVKARWNDVDTINNWVINYQSTHSWLDLINPGPDYMKPTGQPNAAYYRTDGIHLTYYGYLIWAQHVKASVMRGLEKLRPVNN